MHKFIFSFFLVLILSPTLSRAQINLNSSGQVGIDTSPSSTIRLLVNDALGGGTRTAIRGAQTGSANTNIGIRGIATSGATNYGVYGSASGGFYDNWAGYFTGDVYLANDYQSSDARLKKNIAPLDVSESLLKIAQLQPVQFEFLSESELRDQKLPVLNPKEGNHIGLIAQDVEKVFPELVIDVAHPTEYEEGNIVESSEMITTKAIDYSGITVVLLGAVKELQAEMEVLQSEVEALKAQLSEER